MGLQNIFNSDDDIPTKMLICQKTYNSLSLSLAHMICETKARRQRKENENEKHAISAQNYYEHLEISSQDDFSLTFPQSSQISRVASFLDTEHHISFVLHKPRHKFFFFSVCALSRTAMSCCGTVYPMG